MAGARVRVSPEVGGCAEEAAQRSWRLGGLGRSADFAPGVGEPGLGPGWWAGF